MALDQTLVDYLAEFYDEAAIRAMWKQAGDALASCSTTLIHITTDTMAGQSSSGMRLSTAQEQRDFMAACKAAIAQLNDETTVDASHLGTGVDFSRRPVEV